MKPPVFLTLSLSPSHSLSLHIFLVLCLDAKASTHDLFTNGAILPPEKYNLTMSQMLFFPKFGPNFVYDERNINRSRFPAASLQETKLINYSILLL